MKITSLQMLLGSLALLVLAAEAGAPYYGGERGEGGARRRANRPSPSYQDESHGRSSKGRGDPERDPRERRGSRSTESYGQQPQSQPPQQRGYERPPYGWQPPQTPTTGGYDRPWQQGSHGGGPPPQYGGAPQYGTPPPPPYSGGGGYYGGYPQQQP